MANESRIYRTALEMAIISMVIYILVGAPGISSSSSSSSSSSGKSSSSQDNSHPDSATSGSFSNSDKKVKIEHLVYPSKNLTCPKHGYTTHIFSTSPLVIYIEDFLGAEEVEHLIALSTNNWTPSTIFNAGLETTDPSIRKSEKASIPRSRLVQCIEERALAFQGWPRDTFIERLWTQRYNVSGHYRLHYDWASSSKHSRRVSSFMVYLSSGEGLRGGGTRFPRLSGPSGNSGSGGERWCEYIECHDHHKNEEKGQNEDGGVTFKPRKGSAVFWMNFDEQGRGYKETIHAGMPVLEGQKIGLNIWSWYQAGHRAPESAGDEEVGSGM